MEKKSVPTWIWSYRLFLAVLTWSAIFARQMIEFAEAGTETNDTWQYIVHSVSHYKYFTLQSNIMVGIWLILVLFWRKDANKLDRLTGSLQGALVTYITVVWLVFMLLLEDTYDPTGWELYANVVNHYVTPNFFIIDFLLSKREKIAYIDIFKWLIYPFAFAGTGIANGYLNWEEGFLYNIFLNIPDIGISGFIKWFSVLLLLFIIIGIIFVTLLNKYLVKIINWRANVLLIMVIIVFLYTLYFIYAFGINAPQPK